jgi:hypothetical protein
MTNEYNSQGCYYFDGSLIHCMSTGYGFFLPECAKDKIEKYGISFFEYDAIKWLLNSQGIYCMLKQVQ